MNESIGTSLMNSPSLLIDLTERAIYNLRLENKSRRLSELKQFLEYLKSNPTPEFIIKQRKLVDAKLARHSEAIKKIKSCNYKKDHESKLIASCHKRHSFSKLSLQRRYIN